MKKHLPNVLLLIVVLANILFVTTYIRNNSLGIFFSTTGIVLLILGVIIFIFFLSIDPGYGWTKSIDLTRNYILIFISMAVAMAGVVLIISGQHLHDLHTESINATIRCQELANGNVEEILKKDWYSLRDQVNRKPLKGYLLQKKSDRNDYKIIATFSDTGAKQSIRNLIIDSEAIPQQMTLDHDDSSCPGVFETNVSIDFNLHQKLNEGIQFDLSVTFIEDAAYGSNQGGTEETIRFSLKNEPRE